MAKKISEVKYDLLDPEMRNHVVRTVRRSRGDTLAGLYYWHELASADGAYFELYVTKGTAMEQIEKAYRQARNERDVVGFAYCIVPAEWIAEGEAHAD